MVLREPARLRTKRELSNSQLDDVVTSRVKPGGFNVGHEQRLIVLGVRVDRADKDPTAGFQIVLAVGLRSHLTAPVGPEGVDEVVARIGVEVRPLQRRHPAATIDVAADNRARGARQAVVVDRWHVIVENDRTTNALTPLPLW